MKLGIVLLGAAALAVACADAGDPEGAASGAGAPSAISAGPQAGPGPAPGAPPITLSGGAIAAGADDATLIVADEDHDALYVVPTSFDPSAARVVALPGPPAQVVDAGDVVLVTVRTLPTDEAREARAAVRGAAPTPDAMTREEIPAPPPKGAASASAAPSASAVPSASASGPKASAAASAGAKPAAAKGAAQPKPQRGTRPRVFDPGVVRKSQGGLLLVLRRDADQGLVERARLTLPPDAWGLALTPDAKRAVVTSAWTARVSVVDLADRDHPAIVATLETPRQPRGIAIANDGKSAWISHLVGSDLTRVDGLDSTSPSVAKVALPAGRSRTPLGAETRAALGYSVLLAPDGKTLYAPRHALGADGTGAWWGAPVVDTLDVASGEPLQPTHRAGSPTSFMNTEGSVFIAWADWKASPGTAGAPSLALTQPRAAIFRRSASTVIVAGEGSDRVAEIDARLPDPAMRHVRTFQLGADYDVFGDFPKKCGAPSGLALSRDDASLFVLCRSTFDLVRVDLDEGRVAARMHLADDGLPVDAAYGRRLFYSARSGTLSGGMGCAGCHPEGLDDGYVWREGEIATNSAGHQRRFLASRALLKLRAAFQPNNLEPGDVKLFARQTPIIAGRTRADGPYAWHGEDADLLARLDSGFQLHRGSWSFSGDVRETGQDVAKVDYLADFLRSGLLPPPTPAGELGEDAKKGQALFESDKIGCASCHLPQRELTDRKTHPLDVAPSRAGFEPERDHAFRTPSLTFLAGSAPYFHDGSAATLSELVDKNGTRMGNTSQLDADEKRQLVAYLESL